MLPLLLCSYCFYCHHPTWRSVLLLLHLPEHCCQMRFICSSTIFISSLSFLKISPGLHNQVHSSLSGTRSCPDLHYFTCAFPDLIISKQKHLSSSLLLLSLCFGLKCPLPYHFLYLNITTLSKMSFNIISFHKPHL